MGAAALGANAGEELGLSREPREKRPPLFLLGSVDAVGVGLGALSLRRKNICAGGRPSAARSFATPKPKAEVFGILSQRE